MLILSGAFMFSCATLDRPDTEMIFASAAMKAASAEQAERRAPDLYRKAEMRFLAAKRYYELKDFSKAKKAAREAKKIAEKAEIIAVLKSIDSSM